MAERSLKFCRMTFLAVTYFANNLSGRNGVLQVWRFGQLLSNRPLICGSCAVLQIWRFKQLLTSCVAERFFELVLQVWRFEWLLTGVIKPGIRFQVSQARRFEQLLIGHEYEPSHSYASQVPLFEQLLAQFQTQGISRAASFATVFMGGQLPVLKHLYFYTFAIWHHDSADCFSLTSSRRKLRSFAFIAFRACAPQKGRELIDALDGFAGTSFAAVRDSASFFRVKPSPRHLLRGHFVFAGHPLPRPWVEWMGV